MSSRGLKLFLSKPLAEWLLRDFHRSDYSQVCMRQLRSEFPDLFFGLFLTEIEIEEMDEIFFPNYYLRGKLNFRRAKMDWVPHRYCLVPRRCLRLSYGLGARRNDRHPSLRLCWHALGLVVDVHQLDARRSTVVV